MKLAAFVLLATCCASAQIVEGTVTGPGGMPLEEVTVRIQVGGRLVTQATTDARGAFRVEELAPGVYTARFYKKGYLAPSRNGSASKAFVISAGSEPVRVRAEMIPLGKISGRVLDGDGHPVPGAAVELTQGSLSGRMETSDAEGKFSVVEVEPGTYTLSARPPAGWKPPAPHGAEHFGWVHTYYPEARDRSGATPIVIRPGAEIWNEDIRLRAVPVHRIAGTVRDSAGRAAAHVTVKLAASDEIQFQERTTVTGDDGTFEFEDLHEGPWRVSSTLGSGEAQERGFVALTMAGHDEERLDMSLSGPFSVDVVVTVETPDPSAPKPRVSLMFAQDFGGTFPISFEKEGHSRVDPVYPGRYRIQAAPPAGPYYVDSITQAGRDIIGQFVEFRPGVLPVSVVLKSDGGAVRGQIEDCGSASIKLVPQDAAMRDFRLVYNGSCREDGRLEIANVRPGSYYAFAFEQNEDVLYLLSRFDQSLINRAVRVEVRKRESTLVELKVMGER